MEGGRRGMDGGREGGIGRKRRKENVKGGREVAYSNGMGHKKVTVF